MAQALTFHLVLLPAVARYGLQVTCLTNPDFKAGLTEYLHTHGVQAIVLGTRRTDPNGGDQVCSCMVACMYLHGTQAILLGTPLHRPPADGMSSAAAWQLPAICTRTAYRLCIQIVLGD
jgi:hypothetical protein